MPWNRGGLAVLIACLASAPAAAQNLDILQGKFAFNWHSDPGKQKCARVAGPLLADFKSAKYRCNLTAKTNTSSGAPARMCTEVKGRKEYIVFDTMKACEEERKTQADAE